MPRHSSHILQLAKRGAEARLQDLIHEARLLLQLFPNIKDSFDRDELPVSFIMAKGSGQLTRNRARRRGRRKMSVAARKAVSQRMKKYWAARRKAKNT